MLKLLIATANLGKLREIQALLTSLELELLMPASIGLELDVVEDGQTYRENATLKAVAYAHASGLISLADDSGLEVDALGGQPGLHSARFSPLPGATDADRRHYLLEKLAGKPRPWYAHFHCTVALANPVGQTWFADGDCPGEILPIERGNNGFGYDPLFLVSGLDKTMAELSMEEKNHLSHRARAVLAARPLIEKLCYD